MDRNDDNLNTRYDDTEDDAAAAYKEVMERTFSATDEEPIVEQPTKAADAEIEAPEGDDAAEDDGVKRARNGRFEKGSKPPSRKSEPSANGDGAEHDDEQAVKPEGEEEQHPKAALPPSSWSVKAKASWDQIPQEIRDEIVKREAEVSQGFAALRDFKDLKPCPDPRRSCSVRFERQRGSGGRGWGFSASRSIRRSVA